MNELHKRRISQKNTWLFFYSAVLFQTDFGFDTKQIDNVYLLDVANNSFLQKKKKKGFPASYLYQYL